jgi:hypothetical protein
MGDTKMMIDMIDDEEDDRFDKSSPKIACQMASIGITLAPNAPGPE